MSHRFVFFPPNFFLYLFALELYRSVVWSPLGRASISASYCIFFATSTFIATKMSRPQPDPPPARLYLHGNTYHGPSFWCRRFLSVKGRRTASGLLSLPLVPLFGAPKRDPSKNREMGRALALGGRCSIMKNNNQLVVGVRGGMDVGEEARWG